MRFDTTKEILSKGIQDVQNAINPKTTLPILSNILVEAGKEDTSLTATDLDIGIISTIPVKPNIEGSIPYQQKNSSI